MTDNPQAANDEPLFNIPAEVWRKQWLELRGTPADRIAASYFWLGVCISSKRSDPEYWDRCLLCDISLRLICDNG